MLTPLLISMLTLAFNIQPVKTEPTTIVVPDDYPTIQEAINAANPGEAIYVRAGTYYEHIVVYKTVQLIGEHRNNTIIDGSKIGTVISITVGNVYIGGFTIQNSGPTCPDRAIYVSETSHNNIITGNNITSIYGDGIYLQHSTLNVIRANIIANNTAGIVLYDRCDGNIIYHNNFINNKNQSCVYLSESHWDNGYPSGGNYWSDYIGVDEKNGPNQDQPGSDGIGDTNYTIKGAYGRLYNDTYPLMKPYTSTHDIVVTNVTVSQMEVRGGDYFFDINVTVKNLGDYIESFNVTTYFDSFEIGRQEITAFGLDAKRTLTFPWNVTAVEQGTYTIKAVADTVQGETNTTNNEYIYGTIPLVEHSIAITNFTAKSEFATNKTVVGQTLLLEFNVTVANKGDFTETFNITVYYNSTLIHTQKIENLLNGTSKTFSLVCNASEVAKSNQTTLCNYTITFKVPVIPGETNWTDNELLDGWVIVAMVGDITGNNNYPDGKCDIRDVAKTAILFGVIYPDSRYEPNCDLTGPIRGLADGKIDIRDIATVVKNFGKIDP